MPKAVGQLNNSWQNILIMCLPASQIMEVAWPWTVHKAAEAFPFVCHVPFNLEVFNTASCNIGVQQ